MFSVGVGLHQGCPLSQILFMIFMDWISRRSWREESVWSGDLRIASLLFADDVVLLVTSDCDHQYALERFAAECEAVGMRLSTSKSEAMILFRKKVGVVPDGGEEGAEPEGKAFDLPVDQRSNLHLWS